MIRSLALLFLTAAPAAAQTIPIKTVPVATGNQFMIFPSRNAAMGGVSIALEDPLLDPFLNPARGADVEGFRFTSAPAFYGIGVLPAAASGRTLPIGALARGSGFFGGATVALQELVSDGVEGMARQNLYGSALFGADLAETGISVGGGAFVASLEALEGVRLLYAAGDRASQDGTSQQYRLGATFRREAGESAELVLLHHRLDMTHWVYDQPRFGPEVWDTRADLPDGPRIEQDQTRGWAVQAGYRRAVARQVELGARLTADWKWHPKIPNYDLMRIPRDPGNSWAYQAGLGMARHTADATFAADLLFEPIWSHTWADALTNLTRPDGSIIRAGDRTVENHFRFHNAQLRMGVEQRGDRSDFLFGLAAHRIGYRLDQQDHLLRTSREQTERWIEWTLSGGFVHRFPAFHLCYTGLLTLGTGQPGVTGWGMLRNADSFAGGDFLVAPSSDLTLQPASVLTHQISLVVPIAP